FQDHEMYVRPAQRDDLWHLFLRVAQARRQREYDHVGLVTGVNVADIGRAFGNLARGRRENGPRCARSCVAQLADLVGARSYASPHDVVGEALEAACALPEPVARGDDLPAKPVLILIPQVGRARRLQSRRQIGGIRRVADEVSLEGRRLDPGLQPGQDDLVFGGLSEVVHQAWENNTSMPRTHKWVYQFSEGYAKISDLLGGTGAGPATTPRTRHPLPRAST